MIIATHDPITQERQDKIRAWLTCQESQWVEQIVAGQISELIANGGNEAMKQAAGVLSARDVPPGTKDKLAAAAVLKLFLVTLAELRNQDSFSNVSLKVQ